MGYRYDLLSHLARYRVGELGIAEMGEFRSRPYPHILPPNLKAANLVAPIRADCLAYLHHEGIRLHRDFHHLNSSQAFTFNMFFPLLSGGEVNESVLLDALDVRGRVAKWTFEAIPDRREKTNFDLLVELADARCLYFEVKLTESGFGTTKPNERRRRKREELYLPRLSGRVRADRLDEEAFFQHYQALRVVSYVDRPAGSDVLLVFPFKNEHALREAQELKSWLDSSIADRVHLIDAEQLLFRCLRDERLEGTVSDALRVVAHKYLLGQ